MESVSAVTFWWPNYKGILVYQDDVLREIEFPIPGNPKGHYKLSEADLK